MIPSGLAPGSNAKPSAKHKAKAKQGARTGKRRCPVTVATKWKSTTLAKFNTVTRDSKVVISQYEDLVEELDKAGVSEE